MQNTNYSEYTVRVSTDPGYYGSNCSDSDGVRIASLIADLIRSEFPEIAVNITNEIGNGKTTGPDTEIAEEIHFWIQDHWTAAL